jgi:hypothetical protein
MRNICPSGEAVVERRTLSNGVRAALRRGVEEHSGCRREIERLAQENSRLATELSRLRARHDDLVRSTEIWIRLYEAHVPCRSGAATPAAAAAGGRGTP